MVGRSRRKSAEGRVVGGDILESQSDGMNGLCEVDGTAKPGRRWDRKNSVAAMYHHHSFTHLKF